MKKTSILLTLISVLLLSCKTDDGKFCVAGEIKDAADTTLYFEHITLGDGIQVVDSARLDSTGLFAFEGDTIGNPEFYRLRIGTQSINLVFDSTETVLILASLPTMASSYKVEGSGACDTLRLLTQRLAILERDIRKAASDRSLTLQGRAAMMDTLVERYKTDVKNNFLYNNFQASASYYAIFQTLGGTMLFNPVESKSDLTWMRAVANAWHQRYPNAPRTQNLVNILRQARRYQAKPREIVLDLDQEKVRELGIIDMTFPDIKGNPRTLSDLKGQVVLLDFTAFALPANQERTLLLRELYQKYHDRGLEIYQVSVDPDHHFWQQRSEKLPWVCVYCEEGVNSDIVQLYQVDHVPYLFLIDRNCDLQAREEHIDDLEKAIEKLL